MRGTGLTARGWTLLAGGLAWCALAGFIGQRDLWWPGLFLALLPIASWLLLLPGAGQLDVDRRVVPAQVEVGAVARVRLAFDPTGIAVGGVARVRDRLPTALGESRWYSFPSGLGRWHQTVTYEIQPRWRGRHLVGPAERTIADGLGLARISRVFPGQTELLATPRVEPLANLRDASGLGMAADTTMLRTGLGGADDVLIRDYRQGDDVRRIHWRSSARTGQLMVRREERAWEPSATVVIDNRARSFTLRRPDERLEWAVSAAASLAVHLLRDGFDLSLVDAEGSTLSPHRVGAGREAVVLEHLALMTTDTKHSLADALAACSRGAEGQLLVAVLGRIDSADALALAEASRHGRSCWALLVSIDPMTDARAAASIREAGWRCVISGPGVPIATAWRGFGAEEAR